MISRRRAVLTGAVAVVAAGAGAAVYVWQSMRPGGRQTVLDQALPDPAGHVQSFDQWRGKVLIVNFWATWCEPCREEIPLFVRLQQQYAARGLQFVGVAIDRPEKVAVFAKDFNINYPLLIGGMEAMEWARQLGNNRGGLPFTVITNREGVVVGNHLGAMKQDAIGSYIDKLL